MRKRAARTVPARPSRTPRTARGVAGVLLAAASTIFPAPARSADWRPVQRVEFYAIGGNTGAELYASIGVHGPRASVGRAIAHTDFRLTWTRDYRPGNGVCTLVSAKPKLVITTTLPKPAGAPLPAPVARSWTVFLAGIVAHEHVHGDQITEMVRKIEAATVGLTVPGDPDCTRIRAEMTTRLSALSREQRSGSRAFDRSEMAQGGNIQRLILALVNGP